MFRDHQLEREELEASKRQLCQEIETLITEHKQSREQVDQQIWDSIDELKEKHKEDLALVIDNGMKQKGELTLINNEYNDRKQIKHSLADELEALHQESIKQGKQMDAHRQTITSQRSELTERETTIQDKSTRIAHLVQKTQELEKFKFVLDYKIKELKKDIKPNAEASGALKEQTTKMEQEVIHFSRVKINLQLIVKDLQLKMEGLKTEKRDLDKTIEKQRNEISSYKDDIHATLQEIKDYKNLKKSIVRMYKKWVNN